MLEKINAAVREIVGQEEFRPTAFYNESLDELRVVVADCSVTEVPITPYISLLERTHPEDGQLSHVGFCVHRASFFRGESESSLVRIEDVLIRLSKIDSRALLAILDVAVPLLNNNDLTEVEFPKKQL
ncbi:MAG: hypothetical protein ABL899_00745 [Nitrospira sp.]